MKAGDYPRIASYINHIRDEKNNNVLFLDGGDTFHGTYPLVNSKGGSAVDLLNDLKIGVIGIAATIVDKVMPDHFSKGIYFTMGNEELPEYIDKLKNKENVDLIVVLSHLGYPQELKIADQVDGIDVLLSAQTHNRVFEPAIVNDTIIIQSGCHGSFLGRLDLEIEDKKIINYNHELKLLDESVARDKVLESTWD